MSIQLSAATVQQFLVGGLPVETNDSSALMGVTVDFNANTMTWSFSSGTRANGLLTPGAHGNTFTVTLNLLTGVWVNNQNGATGVIAATPLATLVTGLKNLRNGVETAAINQTIFDGTQVPW